MDIMLTPTFVIIIAIGIVLISLLGAVYKIGQAEDYTTRFYAMDIALLLDSLQAVPKGINLELEYVLPPQHGLDIEPTKVTITSSVKKSFYFTEDSYYTAPRVTYPATNESKTYTFYRAGNDIGIMTEGTPNLYNYYCEPTDYHFSIQQTQAIIKDEPEQLITGGVILTAHQEPGQDLAKIYINGNPASQHIACTIAKQLSTLYTMPVSIIPVNPAFLPKDDTLSTLNTLKPALHVAIQGLPTSTQTRSTITHAINQGVIPHAQ